MDHWSLRIFETVTEATKTAEKTLHDDVVRNAVGFDVVWAANGRPLPDWYRQHRIELGL